MRVKRQKKNRRTVRFFTVCYGFRQPYKVLCDGTFVHHLVTNEITPADTAVSELLGGPVKLFTTRFLSLMHLHIHELISIYQISYHAFVGAVM